MKANEFVKKYGVEQAKHQVALLQEIQINNNHQDYINSLKRLVESHDFVENMGGIHYAKYCLDLAKQNGFVNYVDKSQYEQKCYLDGESAPKTTQYVYRISYD